MGEREEFSREWRIIFSCLVKVLKRETNFMEAYHFFYIKERDFMVRDREGGGQEECLIKLRSFVLIFSLLVLIDHWLLYKGGHG